MARAVDVFFIFSGDWALNGKCFTDTEAGDFMYHTNVEAMHKAANDTQRSGTSLWLVARVT